MQKKLLIVLMVASLMAPVLFAGDYFKDNNITGKEFIDRGLRCGTPVLYEDEARAIDRSLQEWLLQNSRLLSQSGPAPAVNVYFHVPQRQYRGRRQHSRCLD